MFSWQKFCIAMILGWFWYFSNIKVTGSSPANWINPSWKISVLTRRNFEVRNNISEKCIESFCNFFFIIYDFILFNQRYFWKINRFVWKKKFERFPESFIVNYMFFVQTTIIFFLNLSWECKTVIPLFIIILSVFYSFFLKNLIGSLVVVIIAWKCTHMQTTQHTQMYWCTDAQTYRHTDS